jgi:endonuclease YncB( thermonuclease family)
METPWTSTLAATFAGDLVAGQPVQLTYDEAACTDRCGRTLAYVKAGAVELNTALISGGYACDDSIAPGGAARSDEFSVYEAEAKTSRTGMWGACSSIPCSQ